MKPLDVLYIHHSGSPGGAPRSLGFLLEYAEKSGLDIQLLVVRDGEGTNYLRTKTENVRVVPGIFPFHGSTVSGMSLKIAVKNVIGFFLTLLCAPWHLRKYRPKIVHLNSSCLFSTGFWARLLYPNASIVVHLREPVLSGLAGWPLRVGVRLIADRCIAIDPESAASIAGVNTTLIVNPAGNPHPGVARKLPVDEHPLRLASFSRVVEGNGQLELVNEFLSVAAAGEISSTVELHLYGFRNNGSSYEGSVRAAAGGSRQVFFHDFVSDVFAELDKVDVIVSPFTEAHFARMIIEGYSCGIPAIARDIAGQREVVEAGGTGELYSSKADLAAAIQKITGKKADYAMYSQNSIEAFQSKYTTEAHGEAVLQVYRELTE